MSTPRRKSKGRKGKGRGPQPADLWRAAPELPPPAGIRPATDPTALLKSLGTPPLTGQGGVADHYLAAVVERAAGLATALAAAAELLVEPDPED